MYTYLATWTLRERIAWLVSTHPLETDRQLLASKCQYLSILGHLHSTLWPYYSQLKDPNEKPGRRAQRHHECLLCSPPIQGQTHPCDDTKIWDPQDPMPPVHPAIQSSSLPAGTPTYAHITRSTIPSLSHSIPASRHPKILNSTL